jgi:hypothetical protein
MGAAERTVEQFGTEPGDLTAVAGGAVPKGVDCPRRREPKGRSEPKRSFRRRQPRPSLLGRGGLIGRQEPWRSQGGAAVRQRSRE